MVMLSSFNCPPFPTKALMGLAIFLMAAVAPSHAQLSYTSQQRSAQAFASAQVPQQELQYVDYCPLPYCAPLGYYYPLRGESQLNNAATSPNDFGPAALSTSAQANGSSANGKSAVTSTSNLTSQQISIVASGTVEHRGPGFADNDYSPIATVYGNNGPYARSGSFNSITFDLASTSEVAIEWGISGSINGNAARPSGSFAISSYGSAQRFFVSSGDEPTFSASLTLPAGRYELNANTSLGVSSRGSLTTGAWSSYLTVTTVPEASTLATMSLGLLLLTWAARRQRQG